MGRHQKRKSRSRAEKHKKQYEKKKQSGKGARPPARQGFPPRKLLQGKVQKNPKGFAFILPEDPVQPDCYVDRREAKSLMDGDVVEYRMHREGKRSYAEITGIVRRGQKEILGRFHRNDRHMYIETHDGEVHLIEKEHAKVKEDDWVIAKIVHYPSATSHGVVQVDKVLGENLLPEHDLLVTISRYGLPHVFSPQVLANATDCKEWGKKEVEKPSPGRIDLRKLPFVTIDGEDAKDFDDAVLVVENETDSTFTLYVAIADVSFFVRPKSPLDHSAVERGTSVYFPGTCIPMLPETLSNDLCSLRPQEDKLTLVAEMQVNRTGVVTDSRFYEGIIKTARRMTYTELQGYFDKKPEIVAQLQHLTEPLEAAHKLYRLFLNKRKERGVLDFQLPEMKIQVDSQGIPTGVMRAPHWDAHRLIEEFMVCANSQVAKRLRELSSPALFRVHEAPDEDTIQEVNELMKSLGISQSISEIHPREFSRILEATMGVKGSKTLHQAILRMQKQARYEPDPKGHFGLALKDYCHFTSPIRRYPDLIVHRALIRVIKDPKNAEKIIDPPNFELLGEKTSSTERRAMEAERFITKRKACWFMKERLGEVFHAEVATVVSRGLFLEIPEFGIEGFCPIESLNGFYEYDERRLALRKRPGHSLLSQGDPLQIKVVRVSVEDNEIEFAEEFHEGHPNRDKHKPSI